jgi:transcriptional regulator with XRE-family HTH domain
MTQSQLAKELGVTPQYLSSVLNGKYDATVMTLKLKEWLNNENRV